MSRIAVAQLLIFALVTAVCGYYIADRVFGPDALDEPITVTVHMPDTGGLTTGSEVTYRGVGVGEISDVSIARNRKGVAVTASLRPQTRIPSDAKAVITMESPVAILRLDFRPQERSGPYLTSGDVVTADRTRRPLPLESLLRDFTELADTLPTEDVSVIADTLAKGLKGATGDINRILANSQELLAFGRQRTDQLTRILDNTRRVAETNGGRLRELASAMSDLSGGVRETAPELRKLAHTAPGPARRVTELIEDVEPSLGTLLGNLTTTTQLVGMRGPALEQLMTSAPRGLNNLGSIVDGDKAKFYLVGSLGPVCYNGKPRRPAQETAPRKPEWNYHCTPGQDLSQRGAQNAPRPAAGVPEDPESPPTDPAAPSSGSSTPADGTHDASTGESAPFQIGTTGGQAAVLGPRSWSSLLLQGVH